jgi:hypothetical protein
VALKKTGALKNGFPVQLEQMLSAHRIGIDAEGKEGIRAEWVKTNLQGAILRGVLEAELGGAELGWALGVTSDQAEEANTDKTTVLLADFA